MRELRSRLSEYVKRAAAGERVLIVDRDRVVAELTAPRQEPAAAVTDPTLEDLIERGIAVDAIDDLAGSLLWRIGRLADDDPVTVRVGFATSAAAFGELPRLRNATDEELWAAVESGAVRVEWVGPRGR